MSEVPIRELPVVCAVRVALDPATALRCCAALQEGRSSEHLHSLFSGTRQATAVLTLCASLDKARFENREVPVRLALRLSDDWDDGCDFDLKLTFPAVPQWSLVKTPPPKATANHEPSTGSSSGSSSHSSGDGTSSAEAYLGQRAPNTV